ncbi:DUF2634 domain-containing protein [Paenibacillus thiaminolyticus]|uniref:DUF2634 domain-containing protein n=1 Tax=Paenibacillus thiaminolyticus TaxID=49283 RepID=UPI0035A6EEF8
MIPQVLMDMEDTFEVAEASQPTRTYRIDRRTGRVAGITDGLDAMKQAIGKLLQTERYEHLIYSPNYGTELRANLGYGAGFVQSELERAITEALMQDDRVRSVTAFEFQSAEDAMLVSFTVETTEGTVQTMKEVTVNG